MDTGAINQQQDSNEAVTNTETGPLTGQPIAQNSPSSRRARRAGKS